MIAEDFETYERDALAPGFWAVAVHRVGERADRGSGLQQLSLGAAHRLASTAVDWVWGIHLPRTTRLGRRVRIWHFGSLLLNARSIGNDVHFRHDTTLGPVRSEDRHRPEALPVIEDKVEIGSGACVVGGVTCRPRRARRRECRRARAGASGRDRVRRAGTDHRMNAVTKAPQPNAALQGGDYDTNPTDVSLLELLREDFETYERDPLAPGFWAVAWHRLGNWRMSRPKWLRAPLTAVYRAGHHGIIALWGIDLPYNVKIGRRFRLGHHGCLMLGAREFGDDVTIQHSGHDWPAPAWEQCVSDDWQRRRDRRGRVHRGRRDGRRWLLHRAEHGDRVEPEAGGDGDWDSAEDGGFEGDRGEGQGDREEGLRADSDPRRS